MKEFITNQKILSKEAGCKPPHLCRVIARKVGLGEELADKLSGLTGIDPYLWVAGHKATLKSRLNKFFNDQKTQKLLSKRRVAR